MSDNAKPASGCTVEEAVRIIEQCVAGCDMQIPYYAYGYNQAACEMSDRLNQIRDDLIDALNIINSNAQGDSLPPRKENHGH